jgi:hypothetical protein
MYEFAITKVFWHTPWTPFAPPVLDVHLMEVFWIGFWWHAFMSFAIPFFLVRKLVLERVERPFEVREVLWVLVGVPFVVGVFGAAIGQTIETLATVLLSIVVLFAVGRFFLLRAPSWGFRGPDDVLLGPRGRRNAMLFLAAVYAFYGATMRLEWLPTPTGLILPLALYGLLIAAFVRLVGRAPAPPAPTAPAPPAPAPAALAPPAPADGAPPLSTAPLLLFLKWYAAAFAGTILWLLVLAAAAPWLVFIFYLGLILQGGVGAAVFLALAVYKAVRARPAASPAAAPS